MAVGLCLFSFAFYAMFDARKVGGTIIYWQRWIVVGFFVIVAAVAVLVRRSRQDSHEHHNWFSDPRVWFALFTVWAFIISLFGVDFAESAKRLLGLTAYQALFLWMLPACCAHNPNWRREIMRVLHGVSVTLLLACVVALFVSPATAYRFPRFYGIFAGGSASLVAQMAFASGLFFIYQRDKLRGWSGIILGGLVVLFGGIRTAIVAFLLGFSLVFFRARLWRHPVIVGSICLVLACFLPFATWLLTNAFRNPYGRAGRFIYHVPEEPTTYRLQQWLYTLEVIRTHPFGTGLGAPLPEGCSRRIRYNPLLKFTRAHSGVLALAVETSVVGLFLFMVGYFLLLHRTWRLCRLGGEEGALGIAALYYLGGALAVLALSSTFPAAGYIHELVIWLLAGIVLSIPVERSSPNGENGEGRERQRCFASPPENATCRNAEKETER